MATNRLDRVLIPLSLAILGFLFLIVMGLLIGSGKWEDETNGRPTTVAQPDSWIRDEEPQRTLVIPATAQLSKTVNPGAASPLAKWTSERLKKILDREGTVRSEALITFESPSQLAGFAKFAAASGVKVLWTDDRLRSARVVFDDLETLANVLNTADDESIDIAPNYVAQVPGLPVEDPERTDDENAGGRAPFSESLMESLGAAQNREDWGTGITVAILDSGVAVHSTLEGVEVQTTTLIEDAEIVNGHGTAMASLVAGRLFPAEGIAQASRILDIRVADEDGFSNTALLAEGIMTAADSGAQVINISLGSFGDSSTLRDAINYALERQIIVVASAGNEQFSTIAYPAAYPGVVAVAAVDANNKQAWFSNSGENITLAAPGVGILSAYTENELVIGSGTSQATALTSGAIAAMLGWNYEPEQIIEELQRNAHVTGAPPEQVGAGVLRLPEK